MDSDNIVRNVNGEPIVPMGTGKPMSEAPKDTLPKPAPQTPMPAINPEMTRETVLPKAVEKTITFEELAAKKGFGSPDDLAKAYANLESQNKRVEVTLAEALQSREQQVPSIPNIEEVDSTEDALRIVDSRVQKQVNQLRDVMDYEFYLIKNPADRDYAQDALRIVKENPGIKWDVAFKAAKADNIVSVAREQGKQEAYQTIEKKKDSQSIHSSSRSPEINTKDIIEGIKTGKIPLSEARKFINSLQ